MLRWSWGEASECSGVRIGLIACISASSQMMRVAAAFSRVRLFVVARYVQVRPLFAASSAANVLPVYAPSVSSTQVNPAFPSSN